MTTDDPCDEMVTFDQAVSYVTATFKPRAESPYTRLGAILGLSIDQVKIGLFHYMYGGPK